MHQLGGWFLLVFILFYYCIYQLEIKIIIIWRRIKKLKDSVLFLGIIRVESTKWENYYYLVECVNIPLALYWSQQLYHFEKKAILYTWNV